MAAIFGARFSSRCAGCDGRIDEGDSVTWDDGEVVHVGCVGLSPEPTPREVCDRCWTEKSTTGVCGCDE